MRRLWHSGLPQATVALDCSRFDCRAGRDAAFGEHDFPFDLVCDPGVPFSFAFRRLQGRKVRPAARGLFFAGFPSHAR